MLHDSLLVLQMSVSTFQGNKLKQGKHKSRENSFCYTEPLGQMRTLYYHLLHRSFDDLLVDRAGIESRSSHATILRDLICNEAFLVRS